MNLPEATLPFTDRIRSKINFIIVSLLVALGLYLFWVALHLRIDFFDAYETLVNARKIATLDESLTYYWKRPFIFPILLSPIFILEQWAQSPDFSLITVHLTCVALFLLLLFVFFKFLRFEFGKTEALLGTLFLAGNTLLIHYAPFAKEDIAATLFTSAAFYLYWKSQNSGNAGFLWSAGILTMFAIGIRYNLIPFLFGVFLIYEIINRVFQIKSTGKPRQVGLLVKLIALFIVPVTVYFLLAGLLYTLLDLAPWHSSILKFVQDLIAQYQKNTGWENPNWNYVFLLKSIPFPLHLLFVGGIFLSAKDRRPLSLFFIIWFFAFFLFQTYVIAVREARYLFPLFPPVFYFTLKGALAIIQFIALRIKSDQIKNAFAGMLCFVFAFSPLQKGFSECIKFADPVYSNDFSGKISKAAKSLSQNSSIFWVGPYYTIHPKDYVFDINDKVTYIYHFYGNAIEFYTGKPVYHLPITTYLPQRANNPSEPLVLGPGSYQFIKKGDVIIINRDPTLYITESIPKTQAPLLIEQVNTYRLSAKPRIADETGYEFFSESLPKAAAKSGLTQEGYLIQGDGFPDGIYEVYVQVAAPSREIAPFGFVNVTDGRFEILNPKLTADIPIDEILMVFYDSVTTASFRKT